MITLFDHQKKFVEIADREPKFAAFWEPGCGKTIAILAAVANAKARGYIGKTVVLAPLSILSTAWCADARHFPSIKAVVCWSPSAAKRRKAIKTPGADVLIMNYESFKKHADDLVAVGVTRLVVDESSKLKNWKSQISASCFEFGQRMESVYLLSGTPAPNNHTEYFGQMRCVDPLAFGTNFWRFAYKYFTPVKMRVQGTERIVNWRKIPSMEDEFTSRLGNKSWSLRKIDCLDLPEQIDVTREVQLEPAEITAYLQILNELRAEFADGRAVDVKSNARLMKLRQVTGGHLLDGTRTVHVGSGKMSELLQIVEEIGSNKCVIWAMFTCEIDAICAKIREEGHSCEIIDGRVAGDVRAHRVDSFQSGALQYLVCQPQAAGHGITLTAASYAIYYSLSFSWELYQQSRDRIHRAGQRNVCTYYHLIAPHTVDEKLLDALHHKRSAHDAVMELLADTHKPGLSSEVDEFAEFPA